ncbi:MAG: OsmC family protein [Halothiobacillaceae bacterium]|jgi:putative redox protein|nr:OsmC family protein [Halothiobacillaceae bacterium]MDY0049581.1 OsmC family protein [Halothiobacillaceae bacterium]
MKARVKWVDGMAFMGETESGHALIMDGAADIGGRNLGPRPTEMVLLGLGGCTAIDVIFILKKARQPVEDCWIEIEAERADSVPKVFTRIHLRYVVKGGALDPKQVERAVKLSAEKYCSVSHMLNKSAEITHEHVLLRGDEASQAEPA